MKILFVTSEFAGLGNVGGLAGKRANADMVRTGLCLRPPNGPLFGVVELLRFPVYQLYADTTAQTAAGDHGWPRQCDDLGDNGSTAGVREHRLGSSVQWFCERARVPSVFGAALPGR
jgi:hypothetical protein